MCVCVCLGRLHRQRRRREFEPSIDIIANGDRRRVKDIRKNRRSSPRGGHYSRVGQERYAEKGEGVGEREREGLRERQKLAFLLDSRPRERALAISSHRCQSDLAIVQCADEPFLGFSVGFPRGPRDKERSINDIIHACGGGGGDRTLAVMCAYILYVLTCTAPTTDEGRFVPRPRARSSACRVPLSRSVYRPPLFRNARRGRVPARIVRGPCSTPTTLLYIIIRINNTYTLVRHVRFERRRARRRRRRVVLYKKRNARLEETRYVTRYAVIVR